MVDNSVTDGEKLCNFLNHRLLASAPWDALASALEHTGRHAELVEFYRQITAVALTGRVVSAGVSLAKRVGIQDPAFKREFIALFREYIGIPHPLLDQFFRFSYRAVEAALEQLPNSARRQIEAFARRSHAYCYMCGVPLTFEDQDAHSAYTCEHVWPRAYGGNSIVENLLPACQSCNTNKKANFATWAMPAIQSLILGLSPPEAELQEIHGSFKFALHYRAAQRLATTERMSLKNAFLQLGPWEDVRIRDVGDIVDIFNLENHSAERAVV
jgi:HNH endonuclease